MTHFRCPSLAVPQWHQIRLPTTTNCFVRKKGNSFKNLSISCACRVNLFSNWCLWSNLLLYLFDFCFPHGKSRSSPKGWKLRSLSPVGGTFYFSILSNLILWHSRYIFLLHFPCLLFTGLWSLVSLPSETRLNGDRDIESVASCGTKSGILAGNLAQISIPQSTIDYRQWNVICP